MLWDSSFESWTALEINSQPTIIMLSPAGEEIGRWRGAIPEGEVLELAAQFA